MLYRLFKTSLKITRAVQIIELSHFISKCIDLLKGTLSIKNISIQCNFSQLEFFAKIDQNHFQRVLLNILSNAIKFSPKNGLIKISSEIIKTEFNKPKWLLSVQDNGIGIPFEIQGFVFDQFPWHNDQERMVGAYRVWLIFRKKNNRRAGLISPFFIRGHDDLLPIR